MLKPCKVNPANGIGYVQNEDDTYTIVACVKTKDVWYVIQLKYPVASHGDAMDVVFPI